MSDQGAFAKALLSSEAGCPPGLYSSNGADPASRFAVYRNNVQASLSNALAESYPVVRQLVGREFFNAMAALYLRDFAPASPLLNDYGQDFGDFIQGFGPAAGLPYLADMARLERLRVEAYHAADARALEPARLLAAMNQPDASASVACGCIRRCAPCTARMPWSAYGRPTRATARGRHSTCARASTPWCCATPWKSR